MLGEYFSLCINTENGTLESIPLILPGWTPNLDKLPLCEHSASEKCVTMLRFLHTISSLTDGHRG